MASHRAVIKQSAEAILEIRTTIEDRLDDLLSRNGTAERMLNERSEYLARSGPEVMRKLNEQAEQLKA